MSAKSSNSHGNDFHKYLYLIGIAAVFIMVGSFWYVEYFTKRDVGSDTVVQQTGVASHHVPNPTSNTPGLSPFNTPQGQQVAVQIPAQTVGNSFSSVVRSMMPSVVNVSATTAKNPQPAALPPRPRQNNQPGVKFAAPFSGIAQESIGSGVIVTKDGYILTNFHVIENARHVLVTVFNSMGTKRYHADIIARDEARDLAILKVTPTRNLTPAALGNGENIQVGDPVIAIGSPFGLDQTVSKGIISGKRKIVNIGGTIHKGLLQTDAAINRGNSGGPLIDQNGYVIGINTAIYTTTTAFSGVGFAVPMKSAKDFMEDFVRLPRVQPNLVGQTAAGVAVAARTAAPPILANAALTHEDRGDCANCHQMLPANQTVAFGPNGRHAPGMGPHGRNGQGPVNQFSFAPGGAIGLPAAATTSGQGTGLGVALQPMDRANIQRLQSPVPGGALVVSVEPGGAFDRAGLMSDDIIFKLNGRRVSSPGALDKLLSGFAPGDTVRISIIRAGDRQDLKLLIERPGAQAVALRQPMQQTPMMQQPGIQQQQPGMQQQQPGVQPPRKRAGVIPANTEFEWMGLEMSPITQTAVARQPSLKNKAGGLVAEVDVGSAAERAGIKAKDIVVAINGQSVGSAAALDNAIKGVAGQAGVLLEVERNGQRMFTVLQ